jgi:radical SAM superfamily enzyme YgiQ (UPF0313 family)
MKVTFILPRAERSLWNICIFRWPPLGIYRLATSTPDRWEIEVINEYLQKVNYSSTDLVAISVTTAGANRAYEIADIYRARGTKVVLGGVHVSMLPNEAGEHADAVVIGEADLLWPQVLEDFENNKLKTFYSIKEKPDLAKIPLLKRGLIKGKYFSTNVVQTSRGCPFGCEFCSVSRFNGRKVRTRPIKDILAEIQNFKDLFKKLLIFVDDNIVANPIYAEELFKALKPLKLSWVSQASITIAKNDQLLKLAAESGCKALFVGFESLSQEALKEIKKAYLVSEYRELIKKIHDHGIVLEGAFIFGFDHDNQDVFKRTVDFCYQTNLDLAQFAALTPFPGTKLYERLEKSDRIVNYNWADYDLTHVVFKPLQMSAEELQAGIEWCWQQFYSWKSIAKRTVSLVPKIGLPFLLVTPVAGHEFKKSLRLFNPQSSSP